MRNFSNEARESLNCVHQCNSSVLLRLMNANVKGIINVSQLVAKKMIERNQGGSIVNVSSLVSLT